MLLVEVFGVGVWVVFFGEGVVGEVGGVLEWCWWVLGILGVDGR